MDESMVGGTATPVSEGQRARWFQYRLSPALRGDHNNVFVALLDADLDVDALSRAVDGLVERHPQLRARITESVSGEPQQHVVAPWRGTLEQVDARALDDDALRDRVEADAWRAFEDGARLARCVLYRRAAGDAVFLLAVDHLVCDGWSYWRMLGEIEATLAGACVPAPLARFDDFVDWQAGWLAGAQAGRSLEFWRSALPSIAPALELPHEAGRGGDVAGQRAQTVVLDSASATAIRSLADTHGCTVFAVLATAFQALLHRYSSEPTVVIGTPLPCRGKPAWRDVVGDFVNMVALRADFDPTTTVTDALATTRSALRGAVRHQDYPASELRKRLGAGAPAFHASVVYQNARDAGPLAELWNPAREDDVIARWGGTALRPFPIQQRVALDRMLLVLHVVEFADGIRCDFVHDGSRLDSATASRMAANFVRLLGSMLADPMVAVARLALLDEEERTQVVVGFNDTAKVNDGPTRLHAWFERSVATAPGAIAVRHGSAALTYAGLSARVESIAARLLRAGVAPGDRVAIQLPRGIDLVASVLAVLKAGAAYVPVDPAYPPARVRAVLRDCGAVVRLVAGNEGAHADDASAVSIDVAGIDAAPVGPVEFPHVPADALAYVIYTSGSTGEPKGVMIEHRNACNLVEWALRDADASELRHVLFSTSISFDLAVYEIFVTLAAGGMLEIVRDVLESAPAGTTMINTVPSGMSAVLDGGHVPPSVARVNVAGEPLRASLVERVFARTQAAAVCNLYGPTETTTYSTGVRMARGEAFAPHIGRPIDNTRVYIVDASGEPVPIGVVGEIWIAGDGVARGYLGKPELTAERFSADPFVAGARCYRTGDLGRWRSDGNIVYLGRSDHQVKIRGFRIEPGEIEAALVRLEGVSTAAVVAWGADVSSRRLVAYVVPTPGAALGAEGLRDALVSTLPAHMVPAAFVLLDRLPLTPNGKLDRSALPAPSFGSTQAYRAPEGELETVLAAIWCEVLGIERVGRDDSFFDLGGHSLLAMQLPARLRAAFGVEIALAELFDRPVLRMAAQRIADAQAEALLADDMQAMRAELEGLSDAELMELLEKEAVND